MSLIQSQTTWWFKAEAVTTAGFTSGWYNAEVLNGAQFFLKYAGVSNVGVLVDISPAEARGNGPVSPADALEAITALTSGANGSEGFFFPAAPTSFDRPFKSFRVRMTVSANITLYYFAICQNAAAPG